jgi:phosphocarrier protein HPr
MTDRQVRTLRIVNKRGLHARAAAKFVRTAGQFDAIVRVAYSGQEVSGLSIMGLMMLAAGVGNDILVSAAGRQADEALTALTTLIQDRFGESD